MSKRARAFLAAEEQGTRLIDTTKLAPQLWRPDFLFDNPVRVAERWAYACGRLARILSEGKQSREFVGRLGQLAREYEELWALFMARNLPADARGYATNRFDGLSGRDVVRVYMRAVEDICDRSTGVLGGWYVK